jgi:hypothetical protein
MSLIYRLRPSKETTIEELKDCYLWLSRPTGYKDIEDSNVLAFAEANENIKDSFNRVFSNYFELAQEANNNGICSFTDSLPELKKWKKFPGGNNGIFIEYDRQILSEYFMKSYGIGDCFNQVEYLVEPIIIKKCDDYHILWEKYKDGSFLYISLWQIEHDSKLMDRLFLKLFTRINKKYKEQKELRIILGGRNIPDKTNNNIGYKIQIPIDSIKAIYVQPKTPQNFINELKTVINPQIQIVKLS